MFSRRQENKKVWVKTLFFFPLQTVTSESWSLNYFYSVALKHGLLPYFILTSTLSLFLSSSFPSLVVCDSRIKYLHIKVVINITFSLVFLPFRYDVDSKSPDLSKHVSAHTNFNFESQINRDQSSEKSNYWFEML